MALLRFLIISLLSVAFTLKSVRADLISDVCSKFEDKHVCLSALRGDPRAKGANLKGLTTISIDISEKHAESVRNLVKTLLKQTTDPKLKILYGFCLKNYDDAVDALKGLPRFLKSKDYLGLNVHASGALDDLVECDDNFSEIPPELKDTSDKLGGLICIILVLSNMLKG